MKLILQYIISDGCTYSYEHVLPIEYESAEALICDFEIELDKAIQNREVYFKFGTEEFCTSYFYEDNKILLPNIFTLEEWFSNNNIYP